jgi:hypothetical protein
MRLALIGVGDDSTAYSNYNYQYYFSNLLITNGYLLAEKLLMSTRHVLDTWCQGRVRCGVWRCLCGIRVLGFGVCEVGVRSVRKKMDF